MGGVGSERCPNYRTPHDLHPLRGRLRRPHDWRISRGGGGHPLMDDAHWLVFGAKLQQSRSMFVYFGGKFNDLLLFQESSWYPSAS